jgi:hypothetical protein
MGKSNMSFLSKTLAAALFGMAALNATPAVVSAQGVPDGMTSDTRKISDLPGLQGFLHLPPSQRSQFDIYYAVKIKHASTEGIKLTLNDHGREIPLHMGPDGRISPMPTREQVDSGATLTVVYPREGSEALKLKVYSTQPNGREYDAQGLALGINQANRAMAKIGGILVLALPRLDRVYFVGSHSGTLEANGQSQDLPTLSQNDGDIPAGTTYYVPSRMSGLKIHLSNAPRIALFSNPPK